MKRPNLRLNVVQVNGEGQKLKCLAGTLQRLSGTGVVYTATKNGAEMVAAFLQKQDIDAVYYHADVENEERRSIEQQWMLNKYKVVCSTNALGMGIDKPDIRFVIHYDVPGSPIHYYQEIGRAGRDGSQSQCILLYNPKDLSIQEYFITSSKPEGRYYERVLNFFRGRSLLLIDDIYDSGYTMREVARTLMKADAKAVYPFTITRTLHSDDQ